MKVGSSEVFRAAEVLNDDKYTFNIDLDVEYENKFTLIALNELHF